MKRTLTTAAAMLVGGAGAAGFAAPAGAAGAPELPAELPTNDNSAQTAYHAAATLESAKRSVGDVVPLDEQLTGRSGQDPLAPVTDLVGGTPVGQLAGGAKSAQPMDALEPVGEALQGATEQSGARSGGSTGDALAGGLSGALDGTEIQGAQASTPKPQPANPQSNGQAQIGGQDLSGAAQGAVGDLVAPVAEQAPAPEQPAGDAGARTQTPLRDMPTADEAADKLAGELPIGQATPAASGLADQVGGVVQHGPLGGETQLGG